jgi:nitrite reductase/ring-hydroxylating ferredoxin subunit
MRTFDLARVICRIDDLPDRGTRGFVAGGGSIPLRGFVVRQGRRVCAYLNRCPHGNYGLNWQPDGFLTPDRRMILCAAHGAIFEISTGICVSGPCAGLALSPIEVEIVEGYVVLTGDPDAVAMRYANQSPVAMQTQS